MGPWPMAKVRLVENSTGNTSTTVFVPMLYH